MVENEGRAESECVRLEEIEGGDRKELVIDVKYHSSIQNLRTVLSSKSDISQRVIEFSNEIEKVNREMVDDISRDCGDQE
jgi:hypothetical protein